jgi:hypothetical protein
MEQLLRLKMCTLTLESTHFNFNKCPIYTHVGAIAKFSTNSHETDCSVLAIYGDVGDRYLPSHWNGIRTLDIQNLLVVFRVHSWCHFLKRTSSN